MIKTVLFIGEIDSCPEPTALKCTWAERFPLLLLCYSTGNVWEGHSTSDSELR